MGHVLDRKVILSVHKRRYSQSIARKNYTNVSSSNKELFKSKIINSARMEWWINPKSRGAAQIEPLIKRCSKHKNGVQKIKTYVTKNPFSAKTVGKCQNTIFSQKYSTFLFRILCTSSIGATATCHWALDDVVLASCCFIVSQCTASYG
jgi:hypothetical protein